MTHPDYAFSPVVQQSTPGLIADQLRVGIMTGRVKSGAQLSEGALAKEFGVSRGPVREAMQRLLQEGILRSERNRGIFVMELSDDDVADIYVARMAIECAAIRIILEQDPAPDLGPIRRAITELEAAAQTDDKAAVSNADLAFHAALVGVAGSPRLDRMHGTLLVETRMCIAALEETLQPTTVTAEHRRILEALEARSLEAALESLDAHMHDGVTRLSHPPDPR